MKKFYQTQNKEFLSLALAFLVCFGFLLLLFSSFKHFELPINNALSVHFIDSSTNSSSSSASQKELSSKPQVLAKNFNSSNNKEVLRQNVHVHSEAEINSEGKAKPEKSQASNAADSESSKQTQDSLVIFSPLPQIPQDLRREAFECDAEAKFLIANDGSVATVNLLKLCQNPKLNSLLLRSLKTWRFKVEAAGMSRNIKVKFIVK